MKTRLYLIFLFCFLYFLFSTGKPKDKDGHQIQTNDYYNYIAINEIFMWVSNNGDGSHDPYTGWGGFYWPGGENAQKQAIFDDGLVWGGIVDGEVRVNGNTRDEGLQAGKILPGGIADNPDDPRYRVYKINNNWENLPNGPKKDAFERDYNEWPAEEGAPWVDVNGDGIFSRGTDEPEFVGDEVLWFVSNDLDTSRTRGTYGSDPIGLEIQTLVWGFDDYNFLKDVVFKKYTLINKSISPIDSMYLTYWTDDDLGDANDDFVGCDTLIDLGYAYNGDNQDGDGARITYGLSPPAVGHMFIQGPKVPGAVTDSAKFNGRWIPGYKNLPISSFVLFIGANSTFKDPARRVYQGTVEFYNYMQGLVWNGNPFIDPYTGLPVKFCVPGDPVIGEGWYEGTGWPGGEYPDDRRYIITSGPFSMAPEDTQEVMLAIFMARGDDHIDSITELKKTALKIHDYVGNQISDYWIAGDFQCTLEKSFMRARLDSMSLQATFSNPDQHDYLATAIIKSRDNLSVDSLTLFDDGNHQDQNANDGIWGTTISPIEEENEFIVFMIASDLNTGQNYNSGELARFITVGSVVVDHYEITSEDTIPNPGDRIAFRLTLTNDGPTNGVSDITTLLVALDSCTSPVVIAFPPEYGYIDPGESVDGNYGQSVDFSTACSDSFWTSLKVEIYSDDNLWWTDTISVYVHGTTSDINENKTNLPTKFALNQNYPNPFNPKTIIEYELPARSAGGPITNDVELSIYNLLGQKVATLVSTRQTAGYYQVEWDASGFASGIYYYMIKASDFREIQKMILLR